MSHARRSHEPQKVGQLVHPDHVFVVPCLRSIDLFFTIDASGNLYLEGLAQGLALLLLQGTVPVARYAMYPSHYARSGPAYTYT